MGIESLIVDKTDHGGALIAIQSDYGVGKSRLAIQVSADVPTAYMLLDPNDKYTQNHVPTGGKIDFYRPVLPADASDNDKAVWLASVNSVWNHFLAGKPSPVHPEWGPYGAFVWDTATMLWYRQWNIRVEQRIKASKDQSRQAGPLDFTQANEWMRAIATGRNDLRPETMVLVLLHEEPVYIPDERNPGFKVPHPTAKQLDGWKHTFRDIQLGVRLVRRASAKLRDGKTDGKNVRYGVILKHAGDERMIGVETAEPTWEDIKGWL